MKLIIYWSTMIRFHQIQIQISSVGRIDEIILKVIAWITEVQVHVLVDMIANIVPHNGLFLLQEEWEYWKGVHIRSQSHQAWSYKK